LKTVLFIIRCEENEMWKFGLQMYAITFSICING